jgi:urease accessory protein
MTARPLIARALASLSLGAVVLVATAGAASAHPADEAQLGGSLNGFLHPFVGFDHLAVMVAVGAIAALAFGRLPMWAAPAGFVGGMVAGGMLGVAGVEMARVEGVIAASVVLLGISVLAASRTRLGWWLIPAIAFAGAAHGNAHGLEAPASAAPLVYMFGFLLATVTLHAAGAVAGFVLRRFEIGQVIGGAVVAVFGATLVLGS